MNDPVIDAVRNASRHLVRELGFMHPTLAGTDLPPSAVHALIEVGRRSGTTATLLCDLLHLEKSSVSRMVGKLVQAGHLAETADSRDARVKTLSLTEAGRKMLAGIDLFAGRQVGAALARLPQETRADVAFFLSAYGDALASAREARPALPPSVTIAQGYRPGVVGRAVDLHARYYARTVGFDRVFESQVASGMADFVGRLDRPANEIWIALENDTIIGTIAIDGEQTVANTAHLRWFILDDRRRGGGIGKRLLNEALSFCDRQGFSETGLWTFRGLDAARALYEAHGFVLMEERAGNQWGKEVIEQHFVRSRPEGTRTKTLDISRVIAKMTA